MIVQDSRRHPTKGNVVEFVGTYDARKGKPQVKADRIKYWMSVGAKPTDTVHNLLIDSKVIAGKKVNALNKKTPPKKEEKKAA
jgi:small subunit ribosomal protein S16